MKNESHHLLLIEIVRFLAAFSVLVWHYQNFTNVTVEPVVLMVPNQPFYSVLWPFYERGLLGVQAFWAVSGFIFFWKYKSLLSSHVVNAKQFFVLRFSRLYPLHLLTLLLVCLLQWVYFAINHSHFVYEYYDLQHFIFQLFFASNWLSNDFSFNGPIWSVSAEILVYVFFYHYVTQFNAGIKATVFIFSLCVLLSFLHIDVNATNCLKYFFLGGLSYEWQALMKDSKNKKGFDLSLILVLALFFMGLFLAYQFGMVRFKHYTFVLLVMIPVVLYFSPHNFSVSHGLASVIKGLGNLTYSSYLVHFPIQLIIVSCYSYWHLSIPFYNPTFFLFYLNIVLIVSFLTYRLFELPCQRLIRRKWLLKSS